MAKTPLFASLKQALRLSHLARQHQIPADEVLEWQKEQREETMSRREFLTKAAYAGAGIALLRLVPPPLFRDDSDVRIVIVGGGMAGLHAAYILKKHGITRNVTLYEASNRTGGRMFTQKLNGNTGTTELGGEFIDSNHMDIRSLAREFGVQELPKANDTLVPELFWIGGKAYTQEDAIRAFEGIRVQVGKDSLLKGNRLDDLDRTSVAEYLKRLEMEDWFRKVLEVAYEGEMGLALGDQSAVNFAALIGEQPMGRFDMFGESDESIKFLGGNQQICDRLAEAVQDQIRLSRPLIAIQSKDKGFLLTFEGEAKAVEADIVIMTIPYTTLRHVDGIEGIRGMTPEKLQCIRELGAGKNGKYFLDMQSRVWREQGYQGYLYTDRIHTAWDSYHLQNGNAGKSVYSIFFGGENGANVSKGGGEAWLDEISGAFPGFKGQYTGFTSQMNWWKHPWTLGSYICPKPGQYALFSKYLGSRVGNMYFAGEHTSEMFGGFMNGAAESGRIAAEQVLKRVKA